MLGQAPEDMSLWWATKQVWTQTESAANKDAEWKPDVIPERVLFSVPLEQPVTGRPTGDQ